MTTDIVLQEHAVEVNGWRLVVNGADVIVDAGPSRRGDNGGVRRAIVHGEGDTLIINFHNDYSKGVQVHSDVTVQGAVTAHAIRTSDEGGGDDQLVARSANNILQLGDDANHNAIDVRGKGLQVRGGIHVMEEAYFNHAVRVPDITIAAAPGAGMAMMPYSLLERIAELELRLQALENA